MADRLQLWSGGYVQPFLRCRRGATRWFPGVTQFSFRALRALLFRASACPAFASAPSRFVLPSCVPALRCCVLSGVAFPLTLRLESALLFPLPPVDVRWCRVPFFTVLVAFYHCGFVSAFALPLQIAYCPNVLAHVPQRTGARAYVSCSVCSHLGGLPQFPTVTALKVPHYGGYGLLVLKLTLATLR